MLRSRPRSSVRSCPRDDFRAVQDVRANAIAATSPASASSRRSSRMTRSMRSFGKVDILQEPSSKP